MSAAYTALSTLGAAQMAVEGKVGESAKERYDGEYSGACRTRDVA